MIEPFVVAVAITELVAIATDRAARHDRRPALCAEACKILGLAPA